MKLLDEDEYLGIIAGTEPITAKVMSNSSLKVISRVGVGLENVDLEAAKELGIKVFNTPEGVTEAVTELTVGLILNSLRRLNLCDRRIREGKWEKKMGNLFRGKLLGIIGFGRIGQKVAEISRCFDAKVIFHDIANIESSFARQVSLDYLLENSDIISIHVSGKDEVLSREKLSKTKNGVILINTSRGEAVDENKLYEMLKVGKIAYAGIDVFKSEPYKGRLAELDNVILTPHIGSYALEARILMELSAVKNLIEGIESA
jgi:D-3-phosphoglycerate dehydrogenase